MHGPPTYRRRRTARPRHSDRRRARIRARQRHRPSRHQARQHFSQPRAARQRFWTSAWPRSERAEPPSRSGLSDLHATPKRNSTATTSPPRQLRGHGRLHVAGTGPRRRLVDARSDLFSLGMVLYQMATGVTPFQRRHVGDDFRLASSTRDRTPATQNKSRLPRGSRKYFRQSSREGPQPALSDRHRAETDLNRLKRDLDSGRSAAADERLHRLRAPSVNRPQRNPWPSSISKI